MRLLTLCFTLFQTLRRPAGQGVAGYYEIRARSRTSRRGLDFKPSTVKAFNTEGMDIMKIEPGSRTRPILQDSAQRPTSNGDAKDAVGTVQERNDTDGQRSTVILSSMSALRASSGADIDTAKVESIKAALRDGSYTIDSGRIADGMLSTARDLLQTRKG